ncbi:hypothetical protein B7494_g5065 [Chlorociboria aeruginascens]|nr:hypothetical protein B7494_g5065 [Chlorociboria aeruginascens]
MRTSRISQETSKILTATSSARTTRSSLSRFTYNDTNIKTEDENIPIRNTPDIEDTIPSHNTSLKRKRSPLKHASSPNIKTSPSKTPRKPARKIKTEDGGTAISPPSDWEEVYGLMREMRLHGVAQNAAVDTMGCERLALPTVSPKVQRYQTLTALMLSSQTKDTTNAVAMRRLQLELPAHREGAEPGLTLENILAVEPTLLNELIWAVGFHNNKTKYMKATALILRDQYGGDIPDTIEGLISLPGVGPKMGYLCLTTAWGKVEGIGVDVHVHRITNLWGWHKTKTPEETRAQLQAWLPREKWGEINWLLVGFGQTVCTPVPTSRKCGVCELGLKGLCRSADRTKVNEGRKMKELLTLEGNGVVKAEVIKTEELQDGMVSMDMEAEVVMKGISDTVGETSVKEEKVEVEEISTIRRKR